MRAKRNYKKEYARDHASPVSKKARAKRNGARRRAGLRVGDGLEVDHVRPLSRGGTNARGNTRVVTRKVNRKKGAKRR